MKPAPESSRLILVGRRRGARRAARSLGLDPLVIDPADVAREIDLAAAASVFVVAVTEAAVLPAARLRQRLGVHGTTVDTALRCTDKVAMKQAIAGSGIPCARFCGIAPGELPRERLVRTLSLPLMLKSQSGSGSRGARLFEHIDQLPTSVEQHSIAESYISGVEMSVESFVIDGEPVFVNLTEYVDPKWSNLLPATLETSEKDAVLQLNRRAIAALGVERGMTHLEVFRTAAGIVFGELALRPPGGQIMALIGLAYGFDPWEALLLVESGHQPDFPSSAMRTAAMRFLHPGRGLVRSISGVDEARKLATLETLECKLSPGMTVNERIGTGQHCGFALFAGEEDAVRRDLLRFGETLQVRIDPPPG